MLLLAALLGGGYLGYKWCKTVHGVADDESMFAPNRTAPRDPDDTNRTDPGNHTGQGKHRPPIDALPDSTRQADGLDIPAGGRPLTTEDLAELLAQRQQQKTCCTDDHLDVSFGTKPKTGFTISYNDAQGRSKCSPTDMNCLSWEQAGH